MSEHSKRYPVQRTKYCKIVGQTRVDNISNILQSYGFKVVTGEPEDDDVDIWVFKDDKLMLMIEVTNWRVDVYMDFNRAKSIRNNFSNYNGVRKLLVSSSKNNYINRQNYLSKGLNIDYLDIGFQTQPFYHFFEAKGQAYGMMPNDATTKNIVKRRLEVYLKKTGLI